MAISVSGTLGDLAEFRAESALLKGATASAGTIAADRWTLPAGKTNATLQRHHRRGRQCLASRGV